MKYIPKPWGSEELIEINDKYMFKRLTMKKGNRCSLQYHNKKHETIYVISGILSIETGNSQHSLVSKIYKSNDSLALSPGVIHRMEAIEDCIYLEASTPEIDDVVRLSDDYDRGN